MPLVAAEDVLDPAIIDFPPYLGTCAHMWIRDFASLADRGESLTSPDPFHAPSASERPPVRVRMTSDPDSGHVAVALAAAGDAPLRPALSHRLRVIEYSAENCQAVAQITAGLAALGCADVIGRLEEHQALLVDALCQDGLQVAQTLALASLVAPLVSRLAPAERTRVERRLPELKRMLGA